MTLRRQLVNFAHMSVDFRVGPHALDELSSLFKGCVGKPVRALAFAREGDRARYGESVERALVDSGFSVRWLTVADDADAATVSMASRLFSALSEHGITGDDLVVALGDADICSAACWSCRSWCSGTPCALVPTTFDAMVTVATEMRPLSVDGGTGLISVKPEPDLVVCDLDMFASFDEDERRHGFLLLLLAMFVDSRRKWDEFGSAVPELLGGNEASLIQALCWAQTSRKDIVMAHNPSARSALSFGVTTALALRTCLGDDIPWYRLLAEGVRFESRIAVDVADFEVDDLFDLDDRLEDIGIEELPFKLDRDEFIGALRAARGCSSNRFMLSVPACVGGVRLSAVDDDVLVRHAEAYLGSRAEL